MCERSLELTARHDKQRAVLNLAALILTFASSLLSSFECIARSVIFLRMRNELDPLSQLPPSLHCCCLARRLPPHFRLPNYHHHLQDGGHPPPRPKSSLKHCHQLGGVDDFVLPLSKGSPLADHQLLVAITPAAAGVDDALLALHESPVLLLLG